MLGALDAELLLGLAFLAFQSQGNLLGGLGLLMKYGLGLTTKTSLLVVVTTLSLFTFTSELDKKKQTTQ